MNIPPLILQIVCGIAGGIIAGLAFSRISFGGIGNAIAGVVGGALGGQMIQNVWAGGIDASDMQIFLSSVIGGAAGGAMLMVMSGLLKGVAHRSCP